MHERVSKLYNIIYMKADFEPWWQFEGWEETIQETYFYDTEEALEKAFQEMLTAFRAQFENEGQKNGKYFAFGLRMNANIARHAMKMRKFTTV